MHPTRRSFLKAGTGAVVASVLGFDVQRAYAQAQELKIARTTETRSTCPYCSVSCGVIIHTLGDQAKNVTPQVVHVEGDPDHPINRGTLCPKGSSLMQDILNERRVLKPQVRRPGSIIGRTSPGSRPTMKSRAISRRPATTPSSPPTPKAARSIGWRASRGTVAAPMVPQSASGTPKTLASALIRTLSSKPFSGRMGRHCNIGEFPQWGTALFGLWL